LEGGDEEAADQTEDEDVPFHDGVVKQYNGDAAQTGFCEAFDEVPGALSPIRSCFPANQPALPTREEMKPRRRISPANSPTCESRAAGANSLSLFQSLHSDCSTHFPTGTMFLISLPPALPTHGE
jgi:hypothetical protein